MTATGGKRRVHHNGINYFWFVSEHDDGAVMIGKKDTVHITTEDRWLQLKYIPDTGFIYSRVKGFDGRHIKSPVFTNSSITAGTVTAIVQWYHKSGFASREAVDYKGESLDLHGAASSF